MAKQETWKLAVVSALAAAVTAVLVGVLWDRFAPGPQPDAADREEAAAPLEPRSPSREAASPFFDVEEDALAVLRREAARLGYVHDPGIVAAVDSLRTRLAIERLLEEEVYPGIELTDKALRAWFESHADEFGRPRQVRVQHLLLAAAPDDDSARQRARDEAQALRARVDGDGRKAIELAARQSAADAKGRRWGDLGFFTRDRFPGELGEQLFALERPGDSLLFEDDDGVHLFWLLDHREARTFTYEQVREAVRDRALREARRRAVQDYVTKLVERKAAAPAAMVRIAGGEIWLGSTEDEMDAALAIAEGLAGRITEAKRAWFEDETYRFARVRTFYLDTREVTRGAYEAFCEDTDHRRPPGWLDEVAPGDDYPVVGVSWEDARQFCAWAGKRLPTAEEWEFAARGDQRRLYPWGDEPPDGTRANYADKRSNLDWNDRAHDDGHAGLAPVGSYPQGATPAGLLDMAGNAREWTATARQAVQDPGDHRIYAWDKRHTVAGGDRLEPLTMYAVKGGAWDSAADDLRPADRRMLPPDTRVKSLGFRCAADEATR